MSKIIVDSQELKDKILSELEYVLRSGYVDTTKASTLRHFYTNPDLIEVNKTKMKININNKTYLGKYDKNGKLIISLNREDDRLFFQQWQGQHKDGMLKKDYVKDLTFTNGYEEGTLHNCQPNLSRNLDSVYLIYDHKSGGLVL